MTTDEIMMLADAYARNLSGADQFKCATNDAVAEHHRAALQSAIEALQADAARYRWLREVEDLSLRSTVDSKWTRPDGTVFFSRHYLACNGGQCEAEDSLYKAIDAAMALK
jgi:hypothetical protein